MRSHVKKSVLARRRTAQPEGGNTRIGRKRRKKKKRRDRARGKENGRSKNLALGFDDTTAFFYHDVFRGETAGGGGMEHNSISSGLLFLSSRYLPT